MRDRHRKVGPVLQICCTTMHCLPTVRRAASLGPLVRCTVSLSETWGHFPHPYPLTLSSRDSFERTAPPLAFPQSTHYGRLPWPPEVPRGVLGPPRRAGAGPRLSGPVRSTVSAGRAAWSRESREARENPSQSLNIGSPAALRAGERVTAPIHHAGEPHPHAPACRRSPHGPHEGRGGRREQAAPRKSQRTFQGQGGIEGRRAAGVASAWPVRARLTPRAARIRRWAPSTNTAQALSLALSNSDPT